MGKTLKIIGLLVLLVLVNSWVFFLPSGEQVMCGQSDTPAQCFADVAIQNNNIRICDKAKAEEQQECFETVAVALNNRNVCTEIIHAPAAKYCREYYDQIEIFAGTPLVTNAQTFDYAEQKVEVTFEDDTKQEVTVQIADDHFKKIQGLSYRGELPMGKGMLFVYEEPMPVGFLMRDTLISLDIVYVDAGGTVLEQHRNLPSCVTIEGECPVYFSESKEVKYVLEITPTGKEVRSITLLE